MRSRAPRLVERGHHCLCCFAALPEGEDRCPSCDFVSTPSLRRRYWNLNPRIRRVQWLLQAGVLVAFGVIAIRAMPRTATGPGAGWWFLLPLVPAIGFRETVTKLTRHKPTFRAQPFWMVFLGLFGGMAFLDSFDRPWCLFVAIPTLVLMGAVPDIARRFDRWKQGLVDRDGPGEDGGPGSRLPGPVRRFENRCPDGRGRPSLT